MAFNPLNFLRRRVFISYSGDAVEFAKVLAARLESAGYRAVLDKWDLQPGSAYDASLKRLVENSALFIFVVSARSARPDAYALTELAWAVAARRPILGVYPSSDITVIAPVDVRARTLIQREGDPIALTVGEASRIVGAPRALLAKAGMLTLAVVLVITGWSLMRQRPVEQQPLQQAPPFHAPPIVGHNVTIASWLIGGWTLSVGNKNFTELTAKNATLVSGSTGFPLTNIAGATLKPMGTTTFNIFAFDPSPQGQANLSLARQHFTPAVLDSQCAVRLTARDLDGTEHVAGATFRCGQMMFPPP